jgi:hypothetical protein
MDPVYALPNCPYWDAHFWVDWIELFCISNIDGLTDQAAVAKRVRLFKKDLGQAASSEEDKDDSAAEISDKWSARVEQWFGHLEMRATRLGAAYPFELAPDRSRLSLRDKLTDLQRFYLVLLMASALRYFPDRESDITASFELISLAAMRRLLPQGAEVHVFGANKLKDGKFTKDLWSNLEILAGEMLESLRVKKEDFAANNRGDNGADLIGWLKLEPDVPGLLALFAQCACTKEWETKQMTSAPNRWSSSMTFQTNPQNSVFIPHCLRKQSSLWHRI